MNNPVIILGAGGHAKVVAEVLTLSSRIIVGFVTPDLKTGTSFCGGKILGDDSAVSDYSTDEVELVNGVGVLPNEPQRWELASVMRKKGYSFATIIHPSAVVSANVELGEGVQIMAGVTIQSSTEIGKDTIINTGTIVDHDCFIAKNCHLAPGVVVSGGVHIEKNVYIGVGAKIIQSISIGSGSVIAAGSTIYKDIPVGTLVKQQANKIVEMSGGDCE